MGVALFCNLIQCIMEQVKLVELSQNEKRDINGGNVPMSYYMDSDTIQSNLNLISFFSGIFVGFWS
jgi:hypothetical protein